MPGGIQYWCMYQPTTHYNWSYQNILYIDVFLCFALDCSVLQSITFSWWCNNYKTALINTQLQPHLRTIQQNCLSAVFSIAVFFTFKYFFAVHLTTIILNSSVLEYIALGWGVQCASLKCIKKPHKTWPTFLNRSTIVSFYHVSYCSFFGLQCTFCQAQP